MSKEKANQSKKNEDISKCFIEKTKFYSKKIGDLPKGCQACVKGSKCVIFITGLCSRKCYFCPTSDEKQYHDVLYANERKVVTDNEEGMIAGIFDEVRRQNAKGAGITGGDPLQCMTRTCNVIKALKSEFRNSFHIHLYTPLELVDEVKLKQLYDAGLDEIRFHPDVDDDKLWSKLDLPKKFDWEVGIEIPVIPGKEKETEKLIDFAHDKIDFLNLNELELADNSQNKLLDMGYETKNSISYAISGSEQMADDLMDHILRSEYKLNVHFCPVRLKDGVQLTNRILRTGKNVKKSFEKMTNEGLIEHGVIYLKRMKPGYNYQKKIAQLSKEEREDILKVLTEVRDELIVKHKFKPNMIEVDTKKLRLVTSPTNAKITAKKTKSLLCAVTTEYPTYDQIEIEIEFLNK